MVHVFKRVSISDEEAEIRFFRVYDTPPTWEKLKFGGCKSFLLNLHAALKWERKIYFRDLYYKTLIIPKRQI